MNKLPSLIKASIEPIKTVLWRDLASRSLESARKKVNYELAKKLKVLAISTYQKKEREILVVVFSSPLDPNRIKELSFATGLEIDAEEEKEEEVLKAIDASYGGNKNALIDAANLVNSERSDFLKSSQPFLKEVSNKPTPQLLERILERALALAASDIHIEPQKKHFQIRFRVHGLLQKEQALVTPVAASDLIRRIKILAKLDTTCLARPQDGAFKKTLGRDEYSLRVSFVPQHFGEKVVIRLFEASENNNSYREDGAFTKLGLNYQQEFFLKRYLGLDSGAIVLSGPTGSGKSTLLYACLSYLESEWRNIVSLEDPVEQILTNVNQIECKKDGSHLELLSSLLRQDPDVMMIGEIRDRETAETALSASLTGHLVLSTVHAKNCLETFSRFLQLGVSRELLAISLKLVISQRLIQLNCRACLEQKKASSELQKFFALDPETEVSIAKGCGSCSGKGIVGRRGVYEFLPLNDELVDLLISINTENNFSYIKKLKKVALNAGYQPYAFSVREALINGEISPRTALRVLGMAPELMGY